MHHCAFCPIHHRGQVLKEQRVQLSFQEPKGPTQCSHDPYYYAMRFWHSNKSWTKQIAVLNQTKSGHSWNHMIIYLAFTEVTGDSIAQNKFSHMQRGITNSFKTSAVLFPQQTNFWQLSPWKPSSLPASIRIPNCWEHKVSWTYHTFNKLWRSWSTWQWVKPLNHWRLEMDCQYFKETIVPKHLLLIEGVLCSLWCTSGNKGKPAGTCWGHPCHCSRHSKS